MPDAFAARFPLTPACSPTGRGAPYGAQGRLDQARHLHERALAIEEKVLGLQHPSTQRICDALAALARRAS